MKNRHFLKCPRSTESSIRFSQVSTWFPRSAESSIWYLTKTKNGGTKAEKAGHFQTLPKTGKHKSDLFMQHEDLAKWCRIGSVTLDSSLPTILAVHHVGFSRMSFKDACHMPSLKERWRFIARARFSSVCSSFTRSCRSMTVTLFA